MKTSECKPFLKDIFDGLGIQQGDILYVASDITKFLVEAQRNSEIMTAEQRDTVLSALIDGLKNAVGENGTLLFPVFTWNFCRGEVFDRRRTPGEVGALNNWVLRKRLEFQRTRHPLYSFMVWGAYSRLLSEMENVSAWGDDSPFAWLHRENGKMLLIDVSLQRGFTFMHYVEECINVPYRYHKNFQSEYIDFDGSKDKRSYTMYVRDLSISSQEYLPDVFLENAGAMKGITYGDSVWKIIDLVKAYDVVYEDLKYHKGRCCYRFSDYELDWCKGATHENDLGN